MRISFDLDDTLVCYQPGVPQEPCLPWYLRWLAVNKPLRLGTVNLFRKLRGRGWEVWVYTTSYRCKGVGIPRQDGGQAVGSMMRAIHNRGLQW